MFVFFAPSALLPLFSGNCFRAFVSSVLCRSEGGFFKAEMKFPDDFPNSPPEMRFLSEMWHPNGEYAKRQEEDERDKTFCRGRLPFSLAPLIACFVYL